MTDINPINYPQLRNKELASYHAKVGAIINEIYGENGLPQAAAFFIALEKYRSSIATMSTKISLSEADSKGDKAYMGLYHQIHASILHPVDENRLAAEEVFKIFKKTPNPTKMNYNESNGAIDTLLEQLATLPEETLDLANVTMWIEHLRKVNSEFQALSVQQTKQIAERKVGETRKARNELMATWRKLVKFLEVAVDEGDERASRLVNRINVLHSKVKIALSSRATKSSSSNSSTEEKTSKDSSEIQFDEM